MQCIIYTLKGLSPLADLLVLFAVDLRDLVSVGVVCDLVTFDLVCLPSARALSFGRASLACSSQKCSFRRGSGRT